MQMSQQATRQTERQYRFTDKGEQAADIADSAVERYLQSRSGDITESSIDTYRKQLRVFGYWCVDNGIYHVGNIGPVDLIDWKDDRRQEVKKTTLQNDMKSVNDMLAFYERIDVVDDGMSTVLDPDDLNLDREDRISDVQFPVDSIHAALDHWNAVDPYRRDRAVFSTLWDTGARTSGLRALDVDDFDRREGTLTFKNRPHSGTRLKNKQEGERVVNLTDTTTDVLATYIDEHRVECVETVDVSKDVVHEVEAEIVEENEDTVTVEREPLFSTRFGRMAKSSYNRVCERAADIVGESDRKRSPHTVRKARIGDLLSQGWDIQDVSGRCDVGPKTLRQHYDVREENEKAAARADRYGL